MAKVLDSTYTTERTFFPFDARLIGKEGDSLLFRTNDRYPAVILVPRRHIRTEGSDFLMAEGAEVVTRSPPEGVDGTPEREEQCPDGRTQCAGRIKYCCGSVVIGTCQGCWSCDDS